jgi:CHAD domain-containing protein
VTRALRDFSRSATQRIWLNQEAKWLVSQLGPARDLDVFIQELAAPLASRVSEDAGLAQMMAAARTRRNEAYVTATAALNSARTRRFDSRLDAWIDGRGWHAGGGESMRARTLESAAVFAQRHLNQRLRKVRATYGDVEKLSVDERHQLRIAVKKVRYGLEFFSTVLAEKRVNRFTEVLKSLQDSLGHLNDLEVAERTISNLLAGTGDMNRQQQMTAACEAVRLWHRDAAAKAEPETTKLWHKFKKVPPF